MRALTAFIGLLDANSDGRLSREEIHGFLRKVAEAAFAYAAFAVNTAKVTRTAATGGGGGQRLDDAGGGVWTRSRPRPTAARGGASEGRARVRRSGRGGIIRVSIRR